MAKEMESELNITCEHSYSYSYNRFFFFRYLKGRDENKMCHTLRVNFLGIVFVLITLDLYRTLAMDPH